MPNQTIRRIDEKLIPAAIETLSSAFRHDELYKFVVPDENVRTEFLRNFFAFRIRYGMKFGEVHTTSENCEGIAIWIPYRNRRMTFPRIIRSGGLSTMRAIDATTRKKLMSIQEFADKARERISEPYWHLSPIAVHPAHQGQGLASLLIRSMLERLDREPSACLLETQNYRNVAMYERYGFSVVDEETIPTSEVRHWVMWRKAAVEIS